MTSIDRTGRGAETKPFYMTSEFMVLAGMTVALFIASLTLDNLDARLTWILGVSLVGAYILSRGIAKAASSSRSYDPREHVQRDGDHDRDAYRDASLSRETTGTTRPGGRTGV